MSGRRAEGAAASDGERPTGTASPGGDASASESVAPALPSRDRGPTDGVGPAAAASLRASVAADRFATVLADPPWRFQHRTGKVAPEYRRRARYETLTHADIEALPVTDCLADAAHLYLWVPNALLAEGLAVMAAWGFAYKTNLVWFKTGRDGGPDRRGVGFYFRNVTELVLFGVRGSQRTLDPGRRQVNLFAEPKREHSRKPESLYEIVEACSPGPYLELFARYERPGWRQWGDELQSLYNGRSRAISSVG